MENVLNIESQDYIQSVIYGMANRLKEQLDEYFIYALKRKGIEFDNRKDLEAYIIEYCRCEDDVILKEKTYYVKNTPFFMHRYKLDDVVDMKQIENMELKITANIGQYAYL